jgi:multicomponent Na+:H+ antiporter subunit G
VIDVVTAVLLILGAAFILIAAIGVVRLPDVFMRMHAATKAGTLGAALVLLAAALYFATLAVTVKALVVFLFVMVTAPVAAHVLGRAAYYDRVPLWERTASDELAGRYDAPGLPPEAAGSAPLRAESGSVTAAEGITASSDASEPER